MLIRRVTLENYGLYCGGHEFDLAPRVKSKHRRPVILFGGKNGAGKTTLMEAVRLVLYGRSILGPRTTQKEYKAFLHKRIHRPKAAVLFRTCATVGMEFEYVVRGEKSLFRVERAWELQRGNKLVETLSVWKNDEPLTDVDPEYWDDFVRSIVPERLSQLFFFDGEQIKGIAQDDTGADALADSIRSLMGLDLVETLKADLTIYASRTAKRISKGQDKKQLADLDEQIADGNKKLKACGRELAGTQTQINGLEAEIRGVEQFLRSEGYAYAENRESLTKKEATLAERISHLEKELRHECEGLFPLSLCPGIAAALKQQLEDETQLQRWSALRDGLGEVQDSILESVATSLKLGGRKPSKKSLEAIENLVQDAFSSQLAEPANLKDLRPTHMLSAVEAQETLQMLDLASRNSAPKLKRLAKDLEKSQLALRKVRVDLGRIPDEAAVKPHVEKLNKFNRLLGEMTQKLLIMQASYTSQENELNTLVREKLRVETKINEQQNTKGTLDVTKTLQTALTEYLDKLTAEKISRLRGSVADCYNRLSRKEDVFLDIDIDPKTFAVTLFDHKHRPIPKEELSAGEKQIFAIAFLWGLATTSGRQLPVIIDTPLARLDSDHRRNLIENYFPHASHQVLVLSTDTEVDQTLFADLSPNVSHCYHLDYDKTEGCTRPTEGYFWKESASA